MAWTIFLLDSAALKCLLRCEIQLLDYEGDWVIWKGNFKDFSLTRALRMRQLTDYIS